MSLTNEAIPARQSQSSTKALSRSPVHPEPAGADPLANERRTIEARTSGSTCWRLGASSGRGGTGSLAGGCRNSRSAIELVSKGARPS